MYVEIDDLVWTANRWMIVRPYEVELVNIRIITSTSCYP
jgi:hypothetical protein